MTAASLNLLVQQCRDLFGDPDDGSVKFTDQQIEAWINAAIQSLSIHFPRITEYTVGTTAGAHIYELENPFKGVISVEYPTGETPPRFLQRLAYTNPKFFQVEGYYDFLLPQDADSSNPPLLYISDVTPASETITLKLATDHLALSDGDDVTSVQDRHVHLILLYARWCALQERATREAMDPSPLTTLSYTMEINARRAKASFDEALKAAISAEADSAQACWKMDKFDRSY